MSKRPFKAMSTRYRVALVPALKTYRIGLSFTQNADFGSSLVPKRFFAASVLKMNRHIDRIGFRANFLTELCNRESNGNGSQQRGTRMGF